MVQALENLTKASQVIVSKNVTNAYGSQMLMQSFVYSRLGTVEDKQKNGSLLRVQIGIHCQSWIYSDIFLLCHAEGSPAEELMHCQCSRAHLVRYYQASSVTQKLTTMVACPKRTI